MSSYVSFLKVLIIALINSNSTLLAF